MTDAFQYFAKRFAIISVFTWFSFVFSIICLSLIINTTDDFFLEKSKTNCLKISDKLYTCTTSVEPKTPIMMVIIYPLIASVTVGITAIYTAMYCGCCYCCERRVRPNMIQVTVGEPMVSIETQG